MRHDLQNLASAPAAPDRVQRGFSMLEVLITMVIIATALFGTAGLQLYAMRYGQSGQFRSQAVFLASDIAERMDANKLAAVNFGSYDLPLTSTPGTQSVNCASSDCSEPQLAAWDLIDWGNAVHRLLPEASWQVTQIAVGNPSTYQIVINWTDRRSNTQYATAGTGEAFAFTTTRTLYVPPQQ